MAHIAAHFNAEVILVVTVYSDRYIISLSPHFHTPSPFSPSLISLMVSVDVKHHVYLPVEARLLVFHFQAGTGALEQLISWTGIVQVCMPG